MDMEIQSVRDALEESDDEEDFEEREDLDDDIGTV